MPSRPATKATDKRLKANREAAGKVAKKRVSKRVTVKTSINPRMQDLMDGTIKIEDLDDEEIIKGKTRGENGKFGKAATMIPNKFHTALVAEFQKRMQARFEKDVEPMRKVLREIATNPRTSPDARYKSAVFLIERGVGKTPEKQEVTLEMKPWEELLGDDDVLVDYGSEEASKNEPVKQPTRSGKRQPAKRAAKKNPFAD